jgi:hypothetical protein
MLIANIGQLRREGASAPLAIVLVIGGRLRERAGRGGRGCGGHEGEGGMDRGEWGGGWGWC